MLCRFMLRLGHQQLGSHSEYDEKVFIILVYTCERPRCNLFIKNKGHPTFYLPNSEAVRDVRGLSGDFQTNIILLGDSISTMSY